MASTHPADFRMDLRRVLSQYQTDVTADAMQAAREVAYEAVDVIKRAATFGGTGAYLNSLDVRQEMGRTPYTFKFTVCSYMPMLTHLLEHGHAIVKRGFKVGQTQPFPHWSAGQEYIAEKLPQRIAELVERRS